MGPFVITASPHARYISQYWRWIKEKSAAVIKKSSVLSVTEALPIYMRIMLVPMTIPDQKPVRAPKSRADANAVMRIEPIAMSAAGSRAAISLNPPNSFSDATTSQ